MANIKLTILLALLKSCFAIEITRITTKWSIKSNNGNRNFKSQVYSMEPLPKNKKIGSERYLEGGKNHFLLYLCA